MSEATRPKRTVEVVIQRVAIGAACAALVVHTAATRDWEGLLGALCAAAVVLLALVPTLRLLHEPRPGPRLGAMPDER